MYIFDVSLPTRLDPLRSSQLNHLIQNHGFGFIARRIPEIWETDDLGWFWITGYAPPFVFGSGGDFGNHLAARTN